MSDVDRAVAAIEEGKLVVLPTDTVYGLVCTASNERPAHDLYRLKGRDAVQPTAVVFASLDALHDGIPELGERSRRIAQALLPGPFTLVVPNPARRFGWLCGEGRPDTIGIRVPVLVGQVAEVVERARAIVATSANLHGGQDPRRLGDVPLEIREGVAAVIDGGVLPGVPSTVVDVTGAEPVILREGAVAEEAVLELIAAAST